MAGYMSRGVTTYFHGAVSGATRKARHARGLDDYLTKLSILQTPY